MQPLLHLVGWQCAMTVGAIASTIMRRSCCKGRPVRSRYMRLISLLALLIAVLPLLGCGSKPTKDAPTKDAAASAAQANPRLARSEVSRSLERRANRDTALAGLDAYAERSGGARAELASIWRS
jgi:hypothetical protein